MFWIRRETQRIWQETVRWRGDHSHLSYGGWGGVLFTAAVLAVSGWIEIETLERVFHLAITPLAVLWGFQQLSHSSDAVTPRSELLDHRMAWRRTLEKGAQLSGMFGVVAILIFTGLPHSFKVYTFPIVLIFLASAIGNAKTRIVDQEYQVSDEEPKTEVSVHDNEVSGPHWSSLIDVVIFFSVASFALLITRSWHTSMGIQLRLIIGQPWLLYLAIFLYDWLTVAKWGRGLGGILTRRKVQSADAVQLPNIPQALFRALGTVTYLGAWLLLFRIDDRFGRQAFIGILAAFGFLELWYRPTQGRSLRDIVSGTVVVKT